MLSRKALLPYFGSIEDCANSLESPLIFSYFARKNRSSNSLKRAKTHENTTYKVKIVVVFFNSNES